MQRLTTRDPMPRRLRGCILALGNFDGFHLGHQAVVGRAVARGHHERRPVIVATFDPHPVRFFKPDVPPFRLSMAWHPLAQPDAGHQWLRALFVSVAALSGSAP